jgi:hypothetical protein
LAVWEKDALSEQKIETDQLMSDEYPNFGSTDTFIAGFLKERSSSIDQKKN